MKRAFLVIHRRSQRGQIKVSLRLGIIVAVGTVGCDEGLGNFIKTNIMDSRFCFRSIQ